MLDIYFPNELTITLRCCCARQFRSVSYEQRLLTPSHFSWMAYRMSIDRCAQTSVTRYSKFRCCLIGIVCFVGFQVKRQVNKIALSRKSEERLVGIRDNIFFKYMLLCIVLVFCFLFYVSLFVKSVLSL